MTPARALALDVLLAAHTANAWVGELLDEHLTRSSLSAQDRRFATQLVFGVVRRSSSLDALLTPFIQRPLDTVEEAVREVLRLGAFQLALLSHVPKHAAVHETVELANAIDRPQAKGFLNGVLRRVSELVTDEFVNRPGRNALPFDTVGSIEAEAESGTNAGSATDPTPRYRRLTKDILPDPATEPRDYLAAGFSWPRWLAARWLHLFGYEECLRLGFWFNAPPPLWLRVNSLQLDREAYRLILLAKGIDAEPGETPQALRLLDSVPIRDLPGYAEGEFSVQDASSMAVATALQPQPNWRVLDLCAAPGGKTTHIAELMKNRGKIIACDIEAKRLATVNTLCKRLGISIVETVLVDKNNSQPPAGPYDAAIVDVPCSNTGVLGRRPEVRRRLKPTEFEHLIRLQTRLLLTAIEQVKPNGVIVYSTCSIEPDENEGVIQTVRRGMKQLVVEEERYAIPGRPSDGGYWARLRKPR